MLRNANYELSVLKSQLNPTNSEQTTQLKTVFHNEDTLIAVNKKLLAENAELTATLEAKELQLSSEKIKAEQQIAQLKEDLSRADRELKRCQTHVFAITTINEMLIIGNEKRDDIIFEYKRKLQKFNNLSMSSDSESLSEDSSIVQAEQETHKSLGEKAENCVEPCQGLPRNANTSPIHLETYAEFRRHLSEVEEETTDQYLCTLCGWRSSSEGDLKLHLFEKHEMESLSVMLDKCCLD
ncbi:PREDICTED: uncharacterized protein LOC108608745 [Drosophila arizonae]|uniref:Uncharacterized protein LOC108608745 n=1 Tax=Drosophila arizonae TaxID=7263 RepID=A0ABM1NLC8_DROAR|nr:PREDICTED: uncharacterized protein LOC108608745 [Drosophila arizonae]